MRYILRERDNQIDKEKAEQSFGKFTQQRKSEERVIVIKKIIYSKQKYYLISSL